MVETGTDAGAGAGMGRHVERLSRQVAKNDAQVRSLATALQRLTEQVRDLGPTGTGSGSTGGQEEPAKELPSWLMTSDFPEAHALVEALLPWLAAVYLRYPDSELQTCWAWHPDVVEELWWLRNAWYDAYAGEKPSWQKVGDWHDRQRPNVVKRLGAGSCSLARHATVTDTSAPAAPLPDLLPHVLAAWCSTDRTQWPPTPTPEQVAEARRHQQATEARRKPLQR
jgi:hypothetical protein